MSNPLSVRRAMIQPLDEHGNPDGDPTYGILASDDNITTYNDTFDTFEQLEEAIQLELCILYVLVGHEEIFPKADPEKIGHNNFYGKDWQR